MVGSRDRRHDDLDTREGQVSAAGEPERRTERGGRRCREDSDEMVSKLKRATLEGEEMEIERMPMMC